MPAATDQLRAYVEYLRDMGIHDLYRQGDPLAPDALAAFLAEFTPPPPSSARPISTPNPAPSGQPAHMGGVSSPQSLLCLALPFT